MARTTKRFSSSIFCGRVLWIRIILTESNQSNFREVHLSKSKNFYSYDEDTKAVAFLDIIGFSKLTAIASKESPLGPAGLALCFFENSILPYRELMMRNTFKREIPAAVTDQDLEYKSTYVWHQEIPEGAVNFAYMSDCAVIYSNSLTHLFDILSAIFGSAITWAVPIRAGISIGPLHHSEWIERPGMGVSLYGSALTRAVELEKSVKGAGMRIWLESEVVKFATEKGLLDKIVPAKCGKPAELKWWLGAYNPGGPRKTESAELEWQFGRWFTDKYTKDWFNGPNCRRTKSIINRGIAELKSLGR